MGAGAARLKKQEEEDNSPWQIIRRYLEGRESGGFKRGCRKTKKAPDRKKEEQGKPRR